MTEEKKDEQKKEQTENVEYPKVPRQKFDDRNRLAHKAKRQSTFVEEAQNNRVKKLYELARKHDMYTPPAYFDCKLWKGDVVEMAIENRKRANDPNFNRHKIADNEFVVLTDDEAAEYEKILYDENCTILELKDIDIEFKRKSIEIEEEVEWYKYSSKDWDINEKTLKMTPKEGTQPQRIIKQNA